MITDLSPKDTTIQVGDLIRVAGFLPWLPVTETTPGGAIRVVRNGLTLTVRTETVERVRREL